ncbi:MAG: type II secretion system F family protein [Pseudomonadales bacterium]|nr:type II secretion system F family protein [Pseudomonadales bacterium]MDP7577643.1 type II secretion system F family protein [Pseudomonadales bacterium]HJP50754.1 type II secretion system F family protein [Pseudomonadales bacterium]
MKKDVSEGKQLDYAMLQTGLFPELAIQMVTIGEKQGSLNIMFDRMGTFYEDMIESALDGITSMRQPTLIAVLCTIIGYTALTG